MDTPVAPPSTPASVCRTVHGLLRPRPRDRRAGTGADLVPVRDINRIIDLWRSAPGDGPQVRPSGICGQPVRLPTAATAAVQTIAAAPEIGSIRLSRNGNR